MNAELLLAHFHRVADDPDAMPRLRRFILDLAVRGKLVEQDPNDEPASELLKRIATERARLIKEGKARKARASGASLEITVPFENPRGWEWSQLTEMGLINPRNNAELDSLASFVPMTMIPAEYGLPHDHDVRPWSEIKSGFTHFAEGDVALGSVRK